MCHGKQFRRTDERSEYARGERLWDLFYRETEHSAPPVPIAEREERDAEPEEILTSAGRGTSDSH
ncbi:MAG TPA: hypothetical protein VF056_03620 [Thermoleophilaceae bacterium]